jgi:N-formylmaleamate deformylase
VSNGIIERTITIGSIDMHVAVRQHSGSPAVLLLHGLYDRWEVWQPLIAALNDSVSIIAPDLRGHARSSHPEAGYTLPDYADDIARLIDALELETPILVGHSLGALIALSVAAENPGRAGGLVMIDPPLRQGEQGRQLLEILLEARQADPDETFAIISELYAFSGTEADWQRQTEWLRATAPGAFQGMIDMSDDDAFDRYLHLMHRVTCASVLIQADPMSGGVLTDAEAATAIEHLDNGRLVSTPDTGHSVHQDSPDTIAAEIHAIVSAG